MRPIVAQSADELRTWLEPAREASEGKARVRLLEKAESWLKGASTDIRNERFAPIADQALELWSHLRQQSNVELGSVELVGSGRGQRKVALDVTVDGVRGAALSVMSQGELNSLALSLFLPRAMLDDSPFRFIVIDDPVQSMDPARIDGLVRVLERTARTRQVIVFTHDERLHEATRRLQVEATAIGVTRRPRSVVELRKTLDPVSAYLDDAQAVANTDGLAPEVMRRVVPGLCRHALEAACVEVVRGRLLRKGQPHVEVEAQLEDAGKLRPLAALALLDSSQRGGEVTGAIKNRFGPRAADTFRAVNSGAHEGYGGDLWRLVLDTKELARSLLGSR